jgi:hypothetical protein
MKIKYDANNSVGDLSILETNKTTVEYNGRTYTYVGKTKEHLATTTRIHTLLACFIMTLASCLVIPCFFKSFRETFKIAGNELLSGQEIIEHYALHPETFSENQQNKESKDNDLFKIGKEASDTHWTNID